MSSTGVSFRFLQYHLVLKKDKKTFILMFTHSETCRHFSHPPSVLNCPLVTSKLYLSAICSSNVFTLEILCVCVLSRVRLFETPMDCSLPGSSLHGVLARILEWVAIYYSRGSSRPRDRTRISCISCIGRQIRYYRNCTSLHIYIVRERKEIHYLNLNKQKTQSILREALHVRWLRNSVLWPGVRKL